MSRYKMEDGTVVNTNNASNSWDEETRWDGHDDVSINVGPHEHQKLYRSRKGRYYLETWSEWQGSVAQAEWVDNAEAACWLIFNKNDLPSELKHLKDKITE